MISDLRFAWRALWKSPTTTLGAILALALGIGATTTMFGLLNAVALRPLPYPEAERLVELWGNVERQVVERRGTSIPDYLDWKAKSQSFDLMSAWSGNSFIMYGSAAPERLTGEVVAGEYFAALGVEPLLGRALTSADDADNAPLSAVIGERLWQRSFGGRPDAIGQSIQLNNQVFTIVGIAPARFTGRSDASEVWVSMIASTPPQGRAARGNRGFPALARLAPGVSLAQAQADVTNVAQQLAQAYPGTNEKRGVEVAQLSNEVFGQIRPAISLLFGAVAFVLVIACASVASLLLARTESRRREFSLRRAIGADERRLIRLMLSESAWVVALGGTAGCLLAMWAGDALLALSPVQLPSFATPGVDWRTLAFVAGLGVLITVVIGLSPLRSMGKHSLAQDLREGAIEARGGATGRTLQTIVAGQIAVTVTLLVGAALFGRSFTALAKFDPGFDANGVLSMRVQLPVVAGAQAAPPRQGQSCRCGRACAGVAGRSARTSRRLACRARIGGSTGRPGRDLLFGGRHGRGRCDQSPACVPDARLAGLRRDDRLAPGGRPCVWRHRSRRDRGQRDGDVGARTTLLAGRECGGTPHQERRPDERQPVVDDRRRAAGCEPARHSAESRPGIPTSSCRSTSARAASR